MNPANLKTPRESRDSSDFPDTYDIRTALRKQWEAEREWRYPSCRGACAQGEKKCPTPHECTYAGAGLTWAQVGVFAAVVALILVAFAGVLTGGLVP